MIQLVYFYGYNNMYNFEESEEGFEYMDLVNGLPELEGKLKAIQRFLSKVTRGKSPEKIKAMLPLLGFSVVDDDIEYDFGDFIVRFPIEKLYNKYVSQDLSNSIILENLADNLSDKTSTDNKMN